MEKSNQVAQHFKTKGFYANYASITSHNNELKKIKSKIETLKINVSAGADQEVLREIEKLDIH